MPPKYPWYDYFKTSNIIVDEKARPKMHYNTMYLGISEFYEPEKILVSGPATIVFWKDGTKTIVKLSEGDHYDEYTAYCIALTKKLCGSNSKIKSILKKKLVVEEKMDEYAIRLLDSLKEKLKERTDVNESSIR